MIKLGRIYSDIRVKIDRNLHHVFSPGTHISVTSNTGFVWVLNPRIRILRGMDAFRPSHFVGKKNAHFSD